MEKKEYQTGNLVFVIIMLLFVSVLLISIPYQTKWFDNVPLVKQPRLWPTFCIVGMTLFSVFYSFQIWQNYKIKGKIQSELKEFQSWAKPFEFVVYFLLYVWLVPLAGYLLSTLLFFFLLTIREGYRTLSMLLISLATGFGIVVAFKSLLKVKISSGAIYEYLPDGWSTFFMIYF
jgi:hypothetical protein